MAAIPFIEMRDVNVEPKGAADIMIRFAQASVFGEAQICRKPIQIQRSAARAARERSKQCRVGSEGPRVRSVRLSAHLLSK